MATGLVVAFLLARLLRFDVRRLSFWMFWGLPMVYLGSSIFFFLFLESFWAKVILAIACVVGLWLFTENLFAFYHLPATYQAYSLEYLSMVISIGTIYLFSSGAYASQLFLHLPVWIPALVIFLIGLLLCLSIFWVSKIAMVTGVKYAVIGALILSELYVVFAMLPTGFYVNAAALCVCLYMYLGIARAHILDKLSKVVARRYILTGIVFLLLLFLSARWI